MRTRQEISIRLEQWRADRGWAEGAAARSLGVDVSLYRAWESGDADPSERCVVALARHEVKLPSTVRHELGLEPIWRFESVGPPLRSLGDVLRDWRASESLSQRAAARHIGVSSGAVEQWERGAVPSPDNLARLARFWGVDVEALRAVTGPDRVRRPETAGGPSATALARARQAAGLSQRELAERLCVSGATLSRWECAIRRPHDDDVRRVGAVLGLSAAEARALFEGYPPIMRDHLGRLPGLRDVAAAHGLDHVAVAGQTGMPAAHVREWITGRRSVPVAFLELLSELVAVDLRAGVATLRRPRESARHGRHPLAERRARLGLSQQQVADRLGLARATVANWESGRARVPLLQLRPLARALGWDELTAADALGVRVPPAPDLEVAEPGQLGAVIAALRGRTGLSPAQLARAVGVSGVTVRRWERGSTQPSRAAIRRLALAYGVPEQELVRLSLPRRQRTSTSSALAG